MAPTDAYLAGVIMPRPGQYQDLIPAAIRQIRDVADNTTVRRA